MASKTDGTSDNRRRDELRSFLFLTIVMAPALAVMVVGGYGFVVWMMQLIGGPPAGS